MASHGELLHIDEQAGAALRRDRLPAPKAEAAAARYGALGDPTRLALARALVGSPELCVCDLSWVVERPQNLVSHHMKILRAAGLVDARREGKMVMYRLTVAGERLLAV
ncbi:MAG TPA: metalloregulator ArsR/SmtB family transcription factor [Gaiellales bacterium]|jgi:DNA-binding transcriptional ArsR family regulator|nr:metalloregulator ArsR/SmtB family transcription factor [Gaiellales bacterium]